MRGDRRKYSAAARLVAAAAAVVAMAGPSAAVADVTKANNADALNLGTSYLGGTPPVAADKIVYDATVTGPLSASIGDNLTVNGLSFTTFTGAQTITGVAGKRLTLGTGGIVDTNATSDITIGADLNLSASQAFVIPNARTLTFNGAITSAAGVDLTIGGATGTNTAVYLINGQASYTGQTKIIAGTLKLGAANALPSSTVVVVGGTGTTLFALNGFNQTLAGLSSVGSNTRRTINGATSGPTPVLTVNVAAGSTSTYGASLGTNGVAAESNLALTKVGGGLQEFTNTMNVFLTGPLTVSGGAVGFTLANGGATSNFVLDGGVLQNTAAGTFSRALGTTAGQLQFTANGGGFSAKAGTNTVNLGGSSAAVDWLGAPGTGLVGPLKFGHESATSDVAFQNPINLNGAVRTVDVADNAASAADFATLSGTIADGTGGAGGLTKTGAGTLILSAQNSYTGPTAVNGGVLTAAAAGTVPTAGGVSVAGGTALVLRTTGFDAGQADALRAATSFAAGAGFGYDVPTSSTFTVSGPLSGNLQLYKLGGGDLTLPAANTHTGGTNVVAGRLLLGDNAALGTGPLTLGASSAIASAGAAARAIAVPTTVTGAVTFGGSIETGPLTFASAVNLGGAARNLTVLADTTFTNGFTAGGVGQKLGAATLTLGGTSTNTGVIEVRDGTLALAAGATLNSTDALRVMSTVAGGTARAEIRGNYVINTTSGNLRIGHESANGTGVTATQTNVLDLYGSLVFGGFTTGGATQMGSDSAAATINLYNGSLLATRQIVNATPDFGTAVTTVNLDGGTLRALDSRTTYLAGLTGGAFVRANGATVDTNGFDITVGQNLRHDATTLGATADGGLKKIGLGSLTLTGTTNDYTGPTTVSAGALLVNAANGTGSGAVAVNAGGTLGGNGSIAGPITLAAGGKLAPGGSAAAGGTLTVGSLSLTAAVNGPSTGTLAFDIGDAASSDQVVGTAIAYGAGQLEVDDFAFSPLAGIGPGTYALLTGVTAGSLGVNTFAANVPGLTGYNAQLSQAGGQVFLTLTGVPEPPTAGLLSAAAVGLLGRRSRRRR